MRRIACLLLPVLLLGGCSGNWGWYVVDPTTPAGWNNLRFLLSGLGYTLQLSATAIVISMTIGLLVALPGLSSRKGLRIASRTYVELVRAVPLLVLILWVYYGLPQLTGLTLTVFWAGVIALALSDSAFQAEIFRGGIQSIARGQYEAAWSVSLNYRDTMRYVILPQCVTRVLPSWMNLYAVLTMATPLVSIVGVQEVMTLTGAALNSESRVDLLIPLYLFILSWFFFYCYPISRWTARLERRYAVAG